MRNLQIHTLSMAAGALALLLAAGAPDAAAQQRPTPRAETVREAARSGWLGIAFERDAARPRTARIAEVYPNSPADRAGLCEGDVVLRLDGRPATPEALAALRPAPGDEVRLRVRTDGHNRDVRVVAAPRPRQLTAAARRAPARQRVTVPPRVLVIDRDTIRIPMDSIMAEVTNVQRQIRVLIADSLAPRLRQLQRELPEIRFEEDTVIVRRGTARGNARPSAFAFEVGQRAVAGAEFTPLNEGLAEYFGTERGLLVLRVSPGTPAARAGLEAGDVVVRVEGDAVGSVAELRREVARAGRGEREVALGIVRKNRSRELRLRWE